MHRISPYYSHPVSKLRSRHTSDIFFHAALEGKLLFWLVLNNFPKLYKSAVFDDFEQTIEYLDCRCVASKYRSINTRFVVSNCRWVGSTMNGFGLLAMSPELSKIHIILLLFLQWWWWWDDMDLPLLLYMMVFGWDSFRLVLYRLLSVQYCTLLLLPNADFGIQIIFVFLLLTTPHLCEKWFLVCLPLMVFRVCSSPYHLPI